MRRSYLQIDDLGILENEDIFLADSLIIDIYESEKIFTDFERYQDIFDKLLDLQIKVYLKLDCTDLSKTYKALDKTIGKYIGGFVIDNPTKKVLNRLSIKARDYEARQRLRYRAIDFFVIIKRDVHCDNLEKIIKNIRVRDISFEKQDFKETIINLAEKYKKNIIPFTRITEDIDEVETINKKNPITLKEVNESLEFVSDFIKASKKEKKQILKEHSLRKHYLILKLGKKLNLIDDYPIINIQSGKKKERIIKKEAKMKSFYSLGEDIGNAITHGVGIGLALAGLVLLIIKGIRSDDFVSLFSYIIFAVSAIILYTNSTIYHALSLGTKAKGLFRKFDHLTIYILIAGTYTPFTLLALGGTLGLVLCIALWACALIGILLTIFAFGQFRALHIFLYVAMGWVAIFFLPQIIANLEIGGVVLLLAGGIAYTLGLIFYALKVFKYTHMVWHIFVIFGTLFHFLSIYLYL